MVNAVMMKGNSVGWQGEKVEVTMAESIQTTESQKLMRLSKLLPFISMKLMRWATGKASSGSGNSAK
jgi:hypothetical protein